MLRQHRRLFGHSSTAGDVNKQSCFVSDMCRKYLKFVENRFTLRNDGCRFERIAVPPKMKRAAK
jgi:hypothetical protein